MFPNPLFVLLNLKAAQQKFQPVKGAFSGDTGGQYGIIKHASAAVGRPGPTLTVAGRAYVVTDSHLTIPEFQDVNEGFFSAYHHTIRLQPVLDNGREAGEQMVLHLYFDRNDRFCTHVPPVIKPVRDGHVSPPQFVSLSAEELETVQLQFVSKSLAVIKALREQQRQKTAELEGAIAKIERTLDSLSADPAQRLEKLRTKRRLLVELQQYELPSQKQFAERPRNGFFVPTTARELAVLDQLLPQLERELTRGERKKAADERDVTASAGVVEQLKEQSKEQKLRVHEQQRQAEQLAQKQREYDELCTRQRALNERLAVLRASRTRPTEAFGEWLELELLAGELSRDPRLDASAFQQLNARGHRLINTYVNNMCAQPELASVAFLRLLQEKGLDQHIKKHMLPRLAVNAIVAGDHHLLALLLEHYEYPGQEIVGHRARPQHLMTLLEWAVFVNKPGCFEALLKYGHSPFAYDAIESPVNGIFLNQKRHSQFLEVMQRNNLMQDPREFLTRYEQLLQLQLADPLHDKAKLEGLRLQLELNKQQQRLQQKINALISAQPEGIRQRYHLSGRDVADLTELGLGAVSEQESEVMMNSPRLLAIQMQITASSEAIFDKAGLAFLAFRRRAAAQIGAMAQLAPTGLSINEDYLVRNYSIVAKSTELLKEFICSDCARLSSSGELQFASAAEQQAYQQADAENRQALMSTAMELLPQALPSMLPALMNAMSGNASASSRGARAGNPFAAIAGMGAQQGTRGRAQQARRRPGGKKSNPDDCTIQ